MPPESLHNILTRMETARARSPLAAARVTLVGASKSQDAEALGPFLAAGLLEYGENRVQEAEGKWPALKRAYPSARLHLIGPLQSNKAADAVRLFDVIQTVDRLSIAEALVREMEKQGRRPECLIQINTGEEPQKAGVAPAEAEALIEQCRSFGLPVTGLMCVPPADEPPAPHFALLREIGKRNGLSVLSMGMSGDFETAIRMGATHIRVGTALFGDRPQAAQR